LAISKYTAAAQRGVAPGAGTEGLSISEEERRRILAEEQKQLDKLKACCCFNLTLINILCFIAVHFCIFHLY